MTLTASVLNVPFCLPASDPAVDGADAGSSVQRNIPSRHSDQPQPDNPEPVCLHRSCVVVAVVVHCDRLEPRCLSGSGKLCKTVQ